jgi:hypothetical protein
MQKGKNWTWTTIPLTPRVGPTKMRASLSPVSGSIFLSSFFVSFSAMEKERRKKEMT